MNAREFFTPMTELSFVHAGIRDEWVFPKERSDGSAVACAPKDGRILTKDFLQRKYMACKLFLLAMGSDELFGPRLPPQAVKRRGRRASYSTSQYSWKDTTSQKEWFKKLAPRVACQLLLTSTGVSCSTMRDRGGISRSECSRMRIVYSRHRCTGSTKDDRCQ